MAMAMRGAASTAQFGAQMAANQQMAAHLQMGQGGGGGSLQQAGPSGVGQVGGCTTPLNKSCMSNPTQALIVTT